MSVRAVKTVLVKKLDPRHKLARRFVLNGTRMNNKLNGIFRYLLSPRTFVYGLLIEFVTDWCHFFTWFSLTT
jgi:hypothetical protein